MQFQSYFVTAMQDLGKHSVECEPKDADFWGLYGVGLDCGHAYAIGDFSTKTEAMFIKDAIEAS